MKSSKSGENLTFDGKDIYSIKLYQNIAIEYSFLRAKKHEISINYFQNFYDPSIVAQILHQIQIG